MRIFSNQPSVPILLLMFLPFFGFSAQAEKISDQSFLKYNSPFMEVLKTESPFLHEERPVYPVWSRILNVDFFKYQPEVERDGEGECQSQNWLDKNRATPSSYQPTDVIRDSSLQRNRIFDSISQYLMKCDQKIQLGWSFPLVSTYRTVMLQLPINAHPYGRVVLFHLPKGNLVKGFLALKGDNIKRPLIIMRLGVFATATTFLPERFMFMQLFEQSPFNVLVLESNSNRESIFRNRNLSIGGFDEGIQNFEIAKQLQDPGEPIAKIIESVNLSSISMGGHGALYAALLSDLDLKKRSSGVLKKTASPELEPVIRSVLAYCPLINFRDTMDYHLAQSVQSVGFNYWVGNRLRGINQVISGIDEDHFVESLLTWVDKNYQGPVAYSESLPLNDNMKAQLKNFWSENQFWSSYRNVQTPVLILATESDPVVPFPINSGRIQSKYMDLGDSQIKVVTLQAGLHCSLPGAYFWRPMTSLAQAYFLRQSEFKTESLQRSIDLTREEASGMKAKKFPPSYQLQEGKNGEDFFLNLEISELPKTIKSVSFTLNEMGFAESNFLDSKEMIQRWLKQNLRFELNESSAQNPRLVLRWDR